MGWNQGWAMMQEHVIECYNLLGPEGFAPIAEIIIAPYQGSDADEGGKDYGWLTLDGKEVEQVIVDALYPEFAPDKIAQDEYGAKFDDYDHTAYAYGEVFYTILSSSNWRDKLTLDVQA